MKKALLTLLTICMLDFTLSSCKTSSKDWSGDAGYDNVENNELEGLIVLDYKGISVSYLYCETDVLLHPELSEDLYGTKLVFLYRNDRLDMVSVYPDYFTINGIRCEYGSLATFSSTSGYKVEWTIPNEWLDTCGIRLITDVEFALCIAERESLESDDRNAKVAFISDAIKINLSDDLSYVQEYDDNGYEAINQAGIRLVVRSFEPIEPSIEQPYGGVRFSIFTENTSEEAIWYRASSANVNDSSVLISDANYYIHPGQVSYDEIDVFFLDAEQGSVQSVEFSFDIRDYPSGLNYFPALDDSPKLYTIECPLIYLSQD